MNMPTKAYTRKFSESQVIERFLFLSDHLYVLLLHNLHSFLASSFVFHPPSSSSSHSPPPFLSSLLLCFPHLLSRLLFFFLSFTFLSSSNLSFLPVSFYFFLVFFSFTSFFFSDFSFFHFFFLPLRLLLKKTIESFPGFLMSIFQFKEL